MNPHLPTTRTLGERLQIGASLIPPFALLWVAARRGWIAGDSRIYLLAMLGALVLGVMLPSTFAPWHRGVSRIQSWMGRSLLALVLGIVFVLVVLPIGILFRLAGQSFLAPAPGKSLWKPARAPGSLRDQF